MPDASGSRFWSLSGSLEAFFLATWTGQDGSKCGPRAPKKWPRAPKRPPRGPKLAFIDDFLTTQGPRSKRAVTACLLASCLYLLPRCITRSRALHEVWCPTPSRAGMQGSGTSKTSMDGKVDSPHYGGYTTHAVMNGFPRAE